MARKTGDPNYDDAFKDQVFRIWLEDGDQNFAKTARILATAFPNRPNPSDQTLRNWWRDDNWASRAQEFFAKTDDQWKIRFKGRQIAQYDRLLTWQDAVMDPDHPDFERFFGETDQVNLNKIREKLFIELAKTLGVGQHGQKVAQFSIPLPHDPALSGGDLNDVAASFRNRELKQGGSE